LGAADLVAEPGADDLVTRRRPCANVRIVRVWKDRHGNDTLRPDWLQAVCAATQTAFAWTRAVETLINRIWDQRGLPHQRAGRRRHAWRDLHNFRLRRDQSRMGSFAFWFGEGLLTNRQIRITRRRIRRMRRFFERGLRFVFIRDQTGPSSYNCMHTRHTHNRAYTLAPVVYLCPHFFDLGADLQPRTLIHELTHRLFQGATLTGAIAGLIARSLPVAGGMLAGALGHPIVRGRPLNSNDQGELARRLARLRSWESRRSPVNWARLFQEVGTRLSTRP